MNKRSRTSNSIRNMAVAVGCQIIGLLLSFVTRTIFIKLLGDEYNGVNGLFTNILSVLSLAELGIGGAIVFALYKPLAKNDQVHIASLMDFYKKAYRIIAIVVFGIGLCLIPFLDVLVKTDREIDSLLIYYLLYITNSSVSYLFVYKSALINADQQNRTVKLIRTIFLILANIGEIIVLYITQSFIAYLLVQLGCTLLSNFTLSHIANKRYPFLKQPCISISKQERTTILSDIKSIFLYKIGGVILNNTDNIIIAALMGVLAVGYYSNYYMIIGAIITLLGLVFSALSGSIGNLNASGDKVKSEQIFKLCNFSAFWLYGFCSICLFILLDDFVYLWLGPGRVLGKLISMAIALNVYLPGTLSSIFIFRSSTGLFRQAKYVMIFTAILNIFFSVLLGKIWGLAGVLLATSIARVVTSFWYEPLILYRNYFGCKPAKYFLRQLLYFTIWVATGGSLFYLTSLFGYVTYPSFIIKALICTLLPNAVFWLVFRRSSEYCELKERLLGIIKRKSK